jgi:hypothetical protein
MTNLLIQQMRSADDDIGAFRVNSVLTKLCLIDNGTGEYSMFFDGIRRWIPNNETLLTLTNQKSSSLPATGYDGIPRSVYDFPAVAPGQLVKSESDAPVFYIDTDHQLHWVSADQFAKDFANSSINVIEDACFALLHQGSNYKG